MSGPVAGSLRFRRGRQGWQLGLDGAITPAGRIPVARAAGLKARGHPVGADGVYQIVEVVQQLRGECWGNPGTVCTIGMAQNIAAAGGDHHHAHH